MTEQERLARVERSRNRWRLAAVVALTLLAFGVAREGWDRYRWGQALAEVGRMEEEHRLRSQHTGREVMEQIRREWEDRERREREKKQAPPAPPAGLWF
jgi:hypothetical protein